MTFITKGNKLFYAACAAFFSIPDGYIRDLQRQILKHPNMWFQASFNSASVQGKHFPTLLPRPWFRISPIGALCSYLVRVCPHLCWDEVFISGFCVIWFGIINKRPLNWVAKLRQIMVSVQFSQQTELTPSNAHCTTHGLLASEQGA